MEQQIRFCTSADGTRIAYATYGERRDHPLVISPGFAIVQEHSWQEPGHRAFLEAFARGRMLVTYDRRGSGASQREVADLRIEAETADLAAVADHAELAQPDILSYHMTGAVYAALHPERVSRLVLWAPYVRARDTSFGQAVSRMTNVIRTDWPMARRALATFSFPHGPVELQRWYSNMLRDGISPDVAAAFLEQVTESNADFTEILSRVRAPTLVVHPRSDQMVPMSAGKQVAELLTDARFLATDGGQGSVELETAATIVAFLDKGRERGPAAISPQQGNIVTILFTDITDSTALTQRLGDAKAQELVRAHNTIVREALRSHGGTEIKHTGDGIMASFPSASGAIECAMAIQRGVALHGESDLAVHMGLNAGEPVAEEQDLFGTAVQLARRICDQAEGGEILASDVVRQLAAGKGFLFADRGEVALRGFEDPVRLYEVRWQP